jgi:flagellar FliL protein
MRIKMAEEKEITTKPSNLKFFIIGLPIFVVQLIVVYFVTANIIMNKVGTTHSSDSGKSESGEVAKDKKKNSNKKIEYGKYLYSVDDIIVNPQGSNGEQLLLASIAFDLGSEENVTELKAKDVLVKDLVISILSNKDAIQLSNNAFKDSLRTEISQKVEKFLPSLKVNRVYFSKYILN